MIKDLNLTKLLKPLMYTVPLIPVIVSPLTVIISTAELFLAYLILLLLHFLWWCFLGYVFKISLSDHPFSKRDSSDYRSSLLVLIPLIVCTLLTLAFFRRVVTREVFIVALILLFLYGATFRFFATKPLRFRLPALFLLLSLSSATSYIVLLHDFYWPIIPLSIGAGTLPLIPWLANLLHGWSQELPDELDNKSNKRKAYKVQNKNPIKLTSRIYSLCLGVFPAVIFILCTLRTLPVYYLLVCAPILLTPNLLLETRQLEALKGLSDRFLRLSICYPFFIVAILAGLNLL